MSYLSVIIPAHNPHPGRLARALNGLALQSLPPAHWEVLIIDNASTPPLSTVSIPVSSLLNTRLVSEPLLGLSHARRRGFIEARGDVIVLVDDDNVLAPDYLERVLHHFKTHPRVGVIGGPSRPEFETEPAPWKREFFPLLALRDLGSVPLFGGLRTSGASRDAYPDCAPIGAGMALRREAAQAWLANSDAAALTDRRGNDLSSSGDNDIVVHALRAGWEAGYFPDLELLHLIPDSRLTPDYLGRLNRGIQKSWLRLLIHHGLSDWPPITRRTLRLRQAKAWFTFRAWESPAARIRWQGACGHFEGRARPCAAPSP